jgi:hypothetical protein
MRSIISQLWRLLLVTLLGAGGSLIAGLMTYGSLIFKPQDVGFAFIAYGISGGLIFAMYHLRGLVGSVVAASIVSIIQFFGGMRWMPGISAAVWSFGVNGAVVVVAFLFERKLATLGHWKFIVVGLMGGAMFVLMTLLVGIAMDVQALPPALFRQNFVDGLWLGLGLGLGVEAAESIIHSIEEHQHPAR